jgi:brefeldin A-inhibited guanine nucleotide-exchange protein
LSTLVSDPRRDVRAAALNGVFDCLREHGSAVFDEDTWRMVFNGVIKPLFDDIHHQLQHSDRSHADGAAGKSQEGTAASWAASMGPPTCLAALTALVRLFEVHLDSLSFLLDDVLRLIESCIQHDTEAVARIGVEGFKQLLLHTGKSLSAESWQKVTASILQLFNDSMPTKLLCVKVSATDGQLPFRTDDVVIQCVVQLLLIDVLQDTVREHYEHIPPAGIMTLLDALQRSFEFAQEFNQQIELRQTLKRLGFMRDMKQLPALLKQEREALSCSLNVLFQVQADERMLQNSDISGQAVERLMKLCCNVLRNYVQKEQLLQQHQEDPDNAPGGPDREAVIIEIDREVQGLVKIISEVVMRGLKDLQPEQFARYARELFPLLCECSTVNSREVRLMVRDVLMQQVTPMVCAATSDAEV